MWNRVEEKQPEAGPTPGAPVPVATDRRPTEARAPRVATLGSSVFIKGALTGSEDLTVDGRVEGRIDLPEHTLTIGPNATITAEIVAKVVKVFGTVKGNIKAHDMLEIRLSASVEGEVSCSRISIQEGAAFSGKIAMGNRRAKANVPVLAAAV